jgi:hypothetical protein
MNNYQELYSDINESTGPLLDKNKSQIYYISDPYTPVASKPIIQNNSPAIIQNNSPPPKPIMQSNPNPIVRTNSSVNTNDNSGKKLKIFLQLIVLGLGIYGCMYVLRS